MLTGIYGGTFNPLHNGHLQVARRLLNKEQMGEIWFVVSPLNPFKQGKTLLSDEQRLEMVRAALKDEPRMLASDYEFHLPKPSYTWQTMKALAADYPDREFVLIIGADNWNSFDQWFAHEEILSHHRIIVYPRRHCPVDTALLPAGVRLLDMPLIDMSSTDIRQKLADRLPVHELVPDAVATLINRNGYYR